MPEIKRITGPDMLRALKAATKELGHGSEFKISLFDSYDLCKLDVTQLVNEFSYDKKIAEQVVAGLNKGDITELGKSLGLTLVVDKSLRKNLIPNAGLIRSAGMWADNPAVPDSPDDIVEAIKRMRSPKKAE